MMIGILVIIPLEAKAATGISYIYRSWDGSNVVEEVRTCTNYTVMDGNMGADLVSEWYVVNKNVTIDKRLYTKTDTVNIILCDGATLTLKYGITVRGNDTLNFFGQKKGTGTLSCKIHLKTKDYNDYAIIGGDKNNRDTGKLHFYGGCFNLETKDAIWDYRGACIGGGVNGSPKEVVIYGGAFDLNSNEGACIGGGKNGQASRDKNGGIRIYNASIRAYSWGGAAIGNGEEYNGSEGPIEIYGGVMQLYGRSGGAGIGGGGGPSGEKGGSNGPISIYDGLIFASASGGKYTGAGIGGGQKADQGGAIRILGGNVTASSASGAGIGAGATGDAKTIEILGGTVTATATAWGAGIGGGSEGSAGTITIKNAYVTAESSNYGDKDDYIKRLNEITAGLGMKTDQKAYVDSAVGAFALLVDLFNVDYSGAAIGGGHKGSGGTITIVDSTINAKSGDYAAGIGGGEKHGFDAINITGGKLDVTGGKYGAGIGTGDEAKTFGPINITNANVTVHGGEEGAGIGTGNEADSTPTINITDSRIYAYGGKYAAAIGGGDDTGGGNTTIRNSYVYATGGYDGAGIGIASGSPISGFIVYGYDGTAAQSYAEKKGLTFVSLNTPLKNTSSISKTNAKPYETVTLYGSAEGGSEEYTYAFLYKPTSSSSWKVKGTKFGTASTATLTLGTAGTYDILISVKDSSGKTEAKRFTLTIEKTAEFVNTSTISATNVNTGKKITLTGSAKGGAAPYTYTYQYMKPDKTKWTTLGDKYGTAGSVTFNTKIPGTYKARVLAKNSNGTVKISSFTVTAKGTLLENKSTISSTSVKKGSTVTLRGAYSGGTAPYYFTYQYKMPGSTKWNVIGKYNTTSQTASCTVNVTGTYEMRVLIKDSTDYVASKTFKVTVS